MATLDDASLFEEPAPDSSQPTGRRGNVLIGTCSWTDVSLIKAKTFYPRGCNTAEQRLRYYTSQFPIVEVDSSFYAMPTPQNAALWAERSPPGFIFNIKAFRLLTGHQTPLQVFPPDIQPLLAAHRDKKVWYYSDVPAEIQSELWRRFTEAIAPLKAAQKLRAVHFQFAPWATAGKRWREHVEHCVDRMAGHLLAVEFRNETWLSAERVDETLAWERELGVVHVVVDEPQGVGNFAHGVWRTTLPELAIVRLHGRNAETWATKGLSASSERFNYDYPENELVELASSIDRLADEAIELQVLVNVNYEDQGIRAARRLHAILQKLSLANE